MFHAPTAEAKTQKDVRSSQSAPEPVRELSPFVPGMVSSAWSGAATGDGPPRANPGGFGRQLAKLHSISGNQAVLRTLSQARSVIQTKLTVNKPGDEFEQEADRVADQVMRMTAPPLSIQRKCSSCAAEEEKVLRKCAECEEEEKKTGLQRKEAGAGPQFAPPSIHAVLSSSGRPLDAATRAFMEPRFGFDFSAVRVHDNTQAAESAKGVNALAYTVGRNLVFAQGRYEPHKSDGQRLLAHELAHVVQQSNAAPVTVMRQEPEPDGGEPLSACNDQCGQQFEECKGKRDPTQCLADLSSCLHSCDAKNAPAKKPEPTPPQPAPTPQGPKPKTQDYALSEPGLKFIANPPNEGFCPNLYDDLTPGCGRGKGNCTIGIGRLVHNDPCDGRASEEPFNGGVTLEAETRQFGKRLTTYEKMVNDNVKVELTQCQFDALVSFAYNANRGGLDLLLPTINAGKYDEMPGLIKKTKTNEGVLVPRRNREADLFANCNYKPTK